MGTGESNSYPQEVCIIVLSIQKGMVLQRGDLGSGRACQARLGTLAWQEDKYQAEQVSCPTSPFPHTFPVAGWYPSLVDILHWDFPQVLNVHTKHCLTRRARDPEFLTCSHRLPLWDHLLIVMLGGGDC